MTAALVRPPSTSRTVPCTNADSLLATLDDIRNRAHVSKSQLFHYFPDGKEELLLEVARYEADRVLADQQPYLGDLSSWQSWLDWREAVFAHYSAQGSNCPLNAVMSQLGRSTPGAQAVVRELMARWQLHIATGIREMQTQGEVGDRIDADRMAGAVVAGIQGGVRCSCRPAAPTSWTRCSTWSSTSWATPPLSPVYLRCLRVHDRHISIDPGGTMSTEEPLSDDEITTSGAGTGTGPGGDADGTDGGDSDGTDGDATDTTDGDGSDGSDGGDSDGTDGDGSDGDGTDGGDSDGTDS